MHNQALRRARENKGWSQRDVAEKVDTNRFTVTRWERGLATPGPYYRQKLCALFAMSPKDLGLLKEESSGGAPSPSTYWNVPYHRNPFFTGREGILRSLFTQLKDDNTEEETYITALSGLAGVGKTQLAIEYAYSHRHEYQAVLWVSADSATMLLADFGNLTHTLHLEADAQDQQQAIKTVQHWLEEQGSWLLIFDNVEDMEIVRSLIPARGQGHVLLTTRLQTTNTLAKRIEVDVMTPEEGTLFLLRRAKIIPANLPLTAISLPDLQTAKNLSHMMDELPLALDQAGAYIEETGCDIVGYITRYQKHWLQLLQRRGSSADHPASVAATWSISFEKLRQINPIAATFLQFCALLHPDAIPEEIFTATPHAATLAPIAADLLHLDSIINVLRTFSLIRRHPESNTFSLHRLVQTVLLAKMDQQTQQRLAEHLVQAVNAVFPDCMFSTWPLCHRYLPQALACTKLIQQWQFVFPEAARLLYQVGSYLQARASYDQAAQFYQQALEIHRRLGSTEQPEGVQCLFARATLYEVQWKAQEAEKLYQEVLAIRTRSLEPDDPEIAQCLNTLAMFYYKGGKYSQAEPLYLQALGIFQQKSGSQHPDTARCLSDLACLYREQGKYRQAEALQKQALLIREQVFGPEHLETATSLRNLATLYHEQGQFSRAESFYEQALTIREQKLGPDHPDVALILRGLGLLYYGQGKYFQAEEQYRRTLHIRQQALGAGHPALGDIFTLLAELYMAQERWSEAKAYFHSALEIWEPLLEPDHPDVAQCLNGLAEIAVAQGEYAEAELLCQRAMSILEQTFGEMHHYLAQSLNVLAALRCAQECYEQAEDFYQQALMILERNFGKLHPRITLSLNGLAIVYQKQALYHQAAAAYQRMLIIYAQFMAPEHPDITRCQQQYALLQLQTDQQAARG
ncbi:MAG TPA: FxSxx-COOH system tetratricopeptide repeat protein [Ktedonobacteraceae bacterium]|nr:FxSxx-COOH system tetratricopeptide repeat protein [Ktedonobacteraceae bacterium]